MTPKTYHILFLCTGNSARSIIAEGLMNHLGQGLFRAYSAGSHPTGTVNPLAIEALSALGFAVDSARSKSWDEFAAPGAPPLDFVFTVCDKAAGEVCPHWPGQPMTAHWGIEDPAAVDGPLLEKKRAFAKAALYLRRRIDLFLNLPLSSLDTLALQKRLNDIGHS